ncbi:hypothetical protein O3P69_003908 [Scylla paramamosain]|uniref:Uncharacterized protein n=1 Tax=Scylla paramamosain TaxID=85552 RepID=A0AAW0UGL5_SCYPA
MARQLLSLAALVGWLSVLLPARASSVAEECREMAVLCLTIPLTAAKDRLRFDVAAAHHETRAAPKETPWPRHLHALTARRFPHAPPIPRPLQIDRRRPFVHYADRYEEEEEEEYAPPYDERQHFPDYDYESVQYEDNGREPQYDDHHDPDHDRDEYRAPPALRGHRPPHHEEDPHHHQRYPPIDARPPLHRTRGEEGGGGAGSCKTVNKNGMTCEVCRDDEGGYSEHCSHSTRSDQDETYATGRRHTKRDARPRLTDHLSNPSLYLGSERDLTSTTTTTTSATTATATTEPKEAESRQEMDFGFSFDDHDFTFHDGHLFDLDHEPAWYNRVTGTFRLHFLVCLIACESDEVLPSMKSPSDSRPALAQVEKHGMTCYVCPQGAGATAEECMYARHQPDGHDLHYSEETTYGTSSSSSSHYPERSSSFSSSAGH